MRSRSARTASMAPPGMSCISRPRRAMMRSPSAKLIAPETTAAANSPTEWPIMVAGGMPRASQSFAGAIQTLLLLGFALRNVTDFLLQVTNSAIDHLQVK